VIDPSFVTTLRERIDLPALIERSGVQLRRQGANFVGTCPFHTDASPSFTVPANKAFFHCFGCEAHGDGIDFVQRHQGVSFIAAVEQLAAEVGMTLPDRKPAPRQILKATAKFRPVAPAKDGHQLLDDHDLMALDRWRMALPGSDGEKYLQSRRIPLDVAQAAGVGFLPAGEPMGLDATGKPTGFGPRVVVAHQLPDGTVVNLYGRAIDPAADKSIKHRHLPRPKGLFYNRDLLAPGPLWIVEGAFDALALMAAGVPKVCAIFGVAGFDWRWIGRQEIVVAIDHDETGQKQAALMMADAAYRGLKARRLPAQAFGGHKDAAAAWAASELDLSGFNDIVKPLHHDTVADEIRRHLLALPDPDEPHLAGSWSSFKSLAARFVDQQLDEAMAAGWSVVDLFSLPTSRLGAGAGAIWTLADFRHDQLVIYPDRIEAVMGDGHRLVTHRAHLGASGRLPWATSSS
jgi:DNA primase